MDIYAEILGSAINALKKETEEVEMPTFEEKLVEEENDISASLVKDEGKVEKETFTTSQATKEEGTTEIPTFEEETVEEDTSTIERSFSFKSSATSTSVSSEKPIEEQSRFSIDNDQSADWAIRKIANEEDEYLRLCKIADEEIRLLQEKKERLKANFNKKTKHLKNLLAEYFQTVNRKKTATKETYQLLSGKLILKKGKNEFVKDDEKLVEYLKKIGATEFIKESPKWAEFKKTLKLSEQGIVLNSQGEEIGEIIKCVQHEDVFTVEVEK